MHASTRSVKQLSRFVALFLLLQLTSVVQSSADNDWKIEKEEWRRQTSGYLLSTSVNRGKNLPIYVSCPAEKYTLTILKVGYFEGAETKKIEEFSDNQCLNQVTKKARNWNSNFSLDTKDYSGGMYLVKIADTEGFKSFIPLIIRDNKEKARAIFVVPTMTMFAYNSWAGRNTYKGESGFKDRLKVVDFRMPFDSGFGTGKYWGYVHPLIVQVEKTGLDIMYVSDTDIHFNPEILSNRNLYISAGHDEYWTKKERESVINARLNGMNLVFFGANAGYWQTRLKKNIVDNSISMEIYKSKDLDPNKTEPTIRFRDAGYSESELNEFSTPVFLREENLNHSTKHFLDFKVSNQKIILILEIC